MNKEHIIKADHMYNLDGSLKRDGRGKEEHFILKFSSNKWRETKVLSTFDTGLITEFLEGLGFHVLEELPVRSTAYEVIVKEHGYAFFTRVLNFEVASK